MIKLAVFDWNGTLLADFNATHEGGNKIFEFYGYAPISAQEYRRHFTIPFSKTLQNIGIPLEAIKEKGVESARIFHEYYEPRAARARTRKGTRAMLEELKKEGVICIILSNHTVENIYLHLTRLKLTDYFDAVLANENMDGSMHIGKQHRLEVYLKESHIKPQQSIIVGDTVEEIYIGRNLGLKTVAITGGYHTTQRLKDAKPDLIINSLNDIIKITEDL